MAAKPVGGVLTEMLPMLKNGGHDRLSRLEQPDKTCRRLIRVSWRTGGVRRRGKPLEA